MRRASVKMYRELNTIEKTWLNKVLDVDFKGRDILVEQISRAHVLRERNYSFVSLRFRVLDNSEEYPYCVRVPVEMRAFQKGHAPVVFLLHVVDGLINELEIITADSSEIADNCIELNAVEYEINSEVR